MADEKMTKKEKISSFNPNDPAGGDNLFGLPFTEEESDIIVLPVPWEVTVSFRAGTARAPRAIHEASKQVDLFDPDVPDAWKRGIFMKKIDKEISSASKELRREVVKYFDNYDEGETKAQRKIRKRVNESGEWLKEKVKKEISSILEKGKLPVLLGGDHSTPLGFFEALAEYYPDFGILQIDAHCDLRNAYEGFEYSHASIMFNALKIPQVSRLIQVGIRDWCDEEMQLIMRSAGRVGVFFDAAINQQFYQGIPWRTILREVVNSLPQHVYISFDIDGLDPKLCPNTGTPVPGGLEFEQAAYLIKLVVDSGRKIIGCDLNEVAVGKTNDLGASWDANVGARLLYKMCNLMGKSQHQSADATAERNPRNDELILRQEERIPHRIEEADKEESD